MSLDLEEIEQRLGGKIILAGITGSKAYGLDTPKSDEDIRGVYLLPTRQVLSLDFNSNRTTVDHTNADWVFHEVGVNGEGIDIEEIEKDE